MTAHPKHHAITPLPAPRGPAFARGLWRIAAADVSSGNRVRLLHDGPETFDEMLELIHNAKHSVALESYIFRSDEVGHRFFREGAVRMRENHIRRRFRLPDGSVLLDQEVAHNRGRVMYEPPEVS